MTFVITILDLRSPSTSVGGMSYSIKPCDLQEEDVAGEDWGRVFCSLLAFKILCTCAFMLFMVLSWCLILGGALVILRGKLFGGIKVTLRSHAVVVFLREGGREGRLSLVSARISFCART